MRVLLSLAALTSMPVFGATEAQSWSFLAVGPGGAFIYPMELKLEEREGKATLQLITSRPGPCSQSPMDATVERTQREVTISTAPLGAGCLPARYIFNADGSGGRMQFKRGTDWVQGGTLRPPPTPTLPERPSGESTTSANIRHVNGLIIEQLVYDPASGLAVDLIRSQNDPECTISDRFSTYFRGPQRADRREIAAKTPHIQALERAFELYKSKCPGRESVSFSYKYFVNAELYDYFGDVSSAGVTTNDRNAISEKQRIARMTSSDPAFSSYRYQYCDGTAQGNRSTKFPNGRDICEALIENQPQVEGTLTIDPTKTGSRAQDPSDLKCFDLASDPDYRSGAFCYFTNYNAKYQITDPFGKPVLFVHYDVTYPTVFLFDQVARRWIVHPTFLKLQRDWRQQQSVLYAEERARRQEQGESLAEWQRRKTEARIKACQIDNAFSYKYHLCR